MRYVLCMLLLWQWDSCTSRIERFQMIQHMRVEITGIDKVHYVLHVKLCICIVFMLIPDVRPWHQADNKELAATKAEKPMLEHINITTSDSKLAHVFCTWMCGNNCPYQQESIVYIFHSKGGTQTRIADIQTLNEAVLAYHLNIVNHADCFLHSRRLVLLWKCKMLR